LHRLKVALEIGEGRGFAGPNLGIELDYSNLEYGSHDE
jgi:hypothetical protein